ncbi:KAR9-domain-containing protein [Karstenula rhodostoma CBS 690.94]|uniref:KAR9-domain-containing protein n=1 Tax=Karstenula rhodostoma CBS 690.94 TaxID=1392251 RepID=A0A9P4UD38_9PLEO|nr:KAR9-domain-containing protein [Karstenula rhodostoma CBS 690.94]
MKPTALPPETPPDAPSSPSVAVDRRGPSTLSARATTTTSSPRRPESAALESTTKLARISPGLLARMKFLNQNQAPEAPRSTIAPAQIGRISAHKLRELDEFHRDRRSFHIERRGTAWSGTSSQVGTPLIPQLTGESVPALAMDASPPSSFESNRSSFVSTSDRVLPSDSEAGDLNEDHQKYRLPDTTKTKGLSRAVTETGASSDTELGRPPTPPPKDTPPAPEASVLDSENGIDVAAYFHQRHFSRANSIYTLSRASFTNQIQQLTSIKLPPPESLTSEIRALPSSTAAGRALHSAANSIKQWMAKAAEVLSGLDAEDDVEWAAAAGREGLEEVDAAIGKFEGLVNVYITAIEDLQGRADIATLPSRDLTTLVVQMEEVLSNWSKIKKTLKGIKSQVEIAMEWEELWNIVLGEIGMEIENLSRLVFEMEERRHRAISDSVAESAETFNIADLETIVEDTPRQQAREHARLQSNRFSMPTLSIMSPVSPIPQIEQENSRLLALFAKLQPLRASLDFLPMRLQHFQMRASKLFPSACDELTRRKEQLETLEKKLEADADALREELGEDKWVHSFRQAGSKAIAMYESLMKSIQRLRQVIDEGDDEKLGSRLSTYKDKREHYPPSMKRVLELIDIEMKHRSTVNGEILRIQQDVRQKVSDLQVQMKETDMVIEELTATRKLRDSVSTVLSARTEASLTSSALDTPNSSPSSSVIMSRKSSDYGRITPVGKKSRQPSTSSTKSSLTASRRLSSLPMATGTTGRKTISSSRLEALAAPVHPPRSMSATPTPPSEKPRWNYSTNMRDTVVGHNFRPLSLTTPSPHRNDPTTPLRNLRSASSHSAIPVRSPLSQASALSPISSRPTSTTPAHQALGRRPMASPMQSPSTPARGSSALQTTPNTSLPSYRTPTSTRRVTIAAEESDGTATEESPMARRASRPASAMTSRRTSMLPTPKQRTTSGIIIPQITTPGGRTHSRLGSTEDGRRSNLGLDAGRKSSFAMTSGRKSSMDGRQSSSEERPRWR